MGRALTNARLPLRPRLRLVEIHQQRVQVQRVRKNVVPAQSEAGM